MLAVRLSASATTWISTAVHRPMCEPSPVRKDGARGTRPNEKTGAMPPSAPK